MLTSCCVAAHRAANQVRGQLSCDQTSQTPQKFGGFSGFGFLQTNNVPGHPHEGGGVPVTRVACF